MEWFGKVILAAAHLEEAVHNDLSMDACKYNKKMRQLIFNFKVAILFFMLSISMYACLF